jgi:TolA-binding protein
MTAMLDPARFLNVEKGASARPRPAPARARALRLCALALALVPLVSCAYYNTYYLARKYYFKATAGDPYAVDGPAQGSAANFNKSIDYSKKVLAQYPTSKWVDDAYLLWAKSLLGRDDPIQTVNMLQDFGTRFPKSGLDAEALFYLGVGNRNSRRNVEALTALDEFLRRAPRNSLAPNAQLERARALAALERPAEAAEAASQVIERYPKSPLVGRALALRAEARLASGDYERARSDFHALGSQAVDDEQRLNFLLREADCLEAAHLSSQELLLLKDALSHEPEAIVPDTTGGKRPVAPVSPAAQRWGRLMVRYGTAQLQAGGLDEALTAYGRVTRAYPHTELGAEAQYRIGFAKETVAENFDGARVEYGRVRDVMPTGASATLAGQRLANLDRLAQYRTAGGDTLQKRAEAGFLLAELYLFTHDRPERALEEYRNIARTYDGTPYAAKAMNAQGWILSRKLHREASAESLFWRVIYDYPATEGQLAARDYLESAGRTVPDSLIKLPEPKAPPPDTATVLPEFPDAAAIGAAALGQFPAGGDSLRLGPRPHGAGFHMPPPPGGADASPVPGAAVAPLAPGFAPGDSAAARDTTGAHTAAPPDTSHHAAPPPVIHPAAPPDTSHHAAPPGTGQTAAPPDTTRPKPRPRTP